MRRQFLIPWSESLFLICCFLSPSQPQRTPPLESTPDESMSNPNLYQELIRSQQSINSALLQQHNALLQANKNLAGPISPSLNNPARTHQFAAANAFVPTVILPGQTSNIFERITKAIQQQQTAATAPIFMTSRPKTFPAYSSASRQEVVLPTIPSSPHTIFSSAFTSTDSQPITLYPGKSLPPQSTSLNHTQSSVSSHEKTHEKKKTISNSSVAFSDTEQRLLIQKLLEETIEQIDGKRVSPIFVAEDSLPVNVNSSTAFLSTSSSLTTTTTTTTTTTASTSSNNTILPSKDEGILSERGASVSSEATANSSMPSSAADRGAFSAQLFENINLKEEEKQRIIDQFDKLLHEEIARRILSSSPLPNPNSSASVTSESPSLTTIEAPLPTPLPPPATSTTAETATSQTPIISTTAGSTKIGSTFTPEKQQASATSSTFIPSAKIPPQLSSKKLKSFERITDRQMVKLLTESDSASIEALSEQAASSKQLRESFSPLEESVVVLPRLPAAQRISHPPRQLVVDVPQREFRESQPRLPPTHSFSDKASLKDEDHDLSDLRSPTASSWKEDIIIPLPLPPPPPPPPPHHYISFPGANARGILPDRLSYHSYTFDPATGAPLDLEEEGLIDADDELHSRGESSSRLAAAAAAAAIAAFAETTPISERLIPVTTTRAASTTTAPPPSPAPPPMPLRPLEAVTTPPYKGRPHTHNRTVFDVLASDYRERLSSTADISNFLKRFYENAHVELTERAHGRKRRSPQSNASLISLKLPYSFLNI